MQSRTANLSYRWSSRVLAGILAPSADRKAAGVEGKTSSIALFMQLMTFWNCFSMPFCLLQVISEPYKSVELIMAWCRADMRGVSQARSLATGGLASEMAAPIPSATELFTNAGTPIQSGLAITDLVVTETLLYWTLSTCYVSIPLTGEINKVGLMH